MYEDQIGHHPPGTVAVAGLNVKENLLVLTGSGDPAGGEWNLSGHEELGVVRSPSGLRKQILRLYEEDCSPRVRPLKLFVVTPTPRPGPTRG